MNKPLRPKIAMPRLVLICLSAVVALAASSCANAPESQELASPPDVAAVAAVAASEPTEQPLNVEEARVAPPRVAPLEKPEVSETDDLPDLAALEEAWGVRVLSLRLTAEDHMLDFRYRVIDPDKALPIFERKEKPFLLDQKSGKAVPVPSPPKVGPLRNSGKPTADRNYFILFANPGKFIHRGDKVSVVVGDFKAEHLQVQ